MLELTEKLILVSSETGGVFGYDLRQRKSCFSASPVDSQNKKIHQNSVVGLPGSHFIVSAGNGGKASCWDLRQIQNGTVFRQIEFGEGLNFLKLLPSSDHKCWASGSDGTVVCWDVTHDVQSLPISLISDNEPIYNITQRSASEIFTASRKSVVRAYSLPE